MSSMTDTRHSYGNHQPRLIHAVILLVTSGLAVLVTAVLGPSLPLMQEHFKDVPGADYLVPLTLSAPMFMTTILSVFVGELADRFGRKKLLVSAALLYAIVGTAPLYLDSLTTIIASRLALGVMEAVLFTISTALIGDYYEGQQRERYMALHTTVASFTAFLFNTLGGVIAEYGWRAPYWVFAISLVLAPLMIVFLWEPKTRASMTQEQIVTDGQAFNPSLLAFICGLAILMGIAFLTVPVHFAYLYGEIGVKSPSQIGEAFGINSLGVIVGTLIFGWIVAPRLSVAFQLGLSTLIAGLGFVIMEFAANYAQLTTAGFVNGLGCGLLLPTLVTWNMRELPISKRGMGVGAYQSCMFLGMFINPILIVWIEKNAMGARSLAVGFEGRVMLVLGIIALAVGLLISKRRSHS